MRHLKASLTQGLLVVDDDPAVRQVVANTLTRAGLTPFTLVEDAEAALAAVEQGSFDLALLDLVLQGSTGVTLARMLEKRGIPVVFVTGCTDPSLLDVAVDVHPRGFVTKPFSERQLLLAVTLALADRSREDSGAALRDIAQTLVRHGLVSPKRAPIVDAVPEVPNAARLSPREWEIVQLLLAHHRVPSIARRLSLSPATIRNHLKSVFQKLGVHSQQELLHAFL